MKQPLPDDQLERIKESLYGGNKIEAIRRYRDATGAGLADSKAAVETLEAGLRATEPHRFKPAPRGGCLSVIILVAALIAMGGFAARLPWFHP